MADNLPTFDFKNMRCIFGTAVDGTTQILITTMVDPVPDPPPSPPPIPIPPPLPHPPLPLPWEPAANLIRVPASQPIPIVARAQLSAPVVGASVQDPNLSALWQTRLTQTAGPVYSQLQAFSDAGDRMILIEGGVGYSVCTFPGGVRTPLVGAAPRWHKDKIIYFDPTPNPAKLMSLDINGTVTTVWTGPADRPYFKAAQVEEQISDNGWTVAWCHNGQQARLIPVNVETGAIGTSIDLDNLWQPIGPGIPDPTWGKVEPNWVAMSPSGTYLVLGWSGDGTARCKGLELFDRQTGAFIRQVYSGHQHGDQCTLLDGREAYFSVAVNTSDPTLHYYDGTPAKTLRTMPWGSFAHTSCRGPAGWALIDGFQLGTNPYACENEIYLIRLEDSATVKAGEVIRLCHHRSVGDYFSQPRPTWSRDGRWIAWTDNFGAGPAFCMFVALT